MGRRVIAGSEELTVYELGHGRRTTSPLSICCFGWSRTGYWATARGRWPTIRERNAGE